MTPNAASLDPCHSSYIHLDRLTASTHPSWGPHDSLRPHQVLSARGGNRPSLWNRRCGGVRQPLDELVIDHLQASRHSPARKLKHNTHHRDLDRPKHQPSAGFSSSDKDVTPRSFKIESMSSQSSPASSSSAATIRNGHTNPAVSQPVGSPSRARNPPAPSPLSRVAEHPNAPHSSLPALSARRPQHVAFEQPDQSESSACFIHSHLNRHASLNELLQTRHALPPPAGGSALHPTRHTHHAAPARHQAQVVHHHRPNDSSSATSSVTSPMLGPSTTSEIDSDRSSVNGSNGSGGNGGDGMLGSALMDGDVMDEDEEGRSLTRQLAETAQGVREMSRQLGKLRLVARDCRPDL